MHAPASEREITAASRFTPPFVHAPSTIRFVGALDAHTAADALRRVEAVVERRPRHLIVDLAEVHLLDSAGVHALVTLYKRVTAQGGSFVVINVQDQPLAVLAILKLNAAFGLR
ncbi:hypothetical protein BH11MYX4_BH11MYX4_36690 [soil metagenome]